MLNRRSTECLVSDIEGICNSFASVLFIIKYRASQGQVFIVTVFDCEQYNNYRIQSDLRRQILTSRDILIAITTITRNFIVFLNISNSEFTRFNFDFEI